jgi:hypothetical protein
MWNGGVAFTPLTLTRLPGKIDPEIIASLTPARKAATRSEKSAAA